MEWKKIFNKKYDTKITINIRKFLNLMYRDSKVEYDKIVYKVNTDYPNKRLIIEFKHETQK